MRREPLAAWLALAVTALAGLALGWTGLVGIDNQRVHWMITGWQHVTLLAALTLAFRPDNRAAFWLAAASLMEIYLLVPLACAPPPGDIPALLAPFRQLLGDGRFGLVLTSLAVSALPAAVGGTTATRLASLCLLLWPGTLRSLAAGVMAYTPGVVSLAMTTLLLWRRQQR